MKVQLKLVKEQLELVKIFLMLHHSSTNFEIQRYYQNKPEFNCIYSRNNLPKIEDKAFLFNLDKYQSIGTHWIVLHANDDNVKYFDIFGVEHIPKEIKKFTDNENIKRIIYRIQVSYSIMCGYFCIGFVDFTLKGKRMLDYTNFLSPNKYKKNLK